MLVNIHGLREIYGILDTFSRAFEDFLSALTALQNARLTHQIIDLVTLERFLRAKTYNLQTHHQSVN